MPVPTQRLKTRYVLAPVKEFKMATFRVRNTYFTYLKKSLRVNECVLLFLYASGKYISLDYVSSKLRNFICPCCNVFSFPTINTCFCLKSGYCYITLISVVAAMVFLASLEDKNFALCSVSRLP